MTNIEYQPLNNVIPDTYLTSDGENFPIEKKIDFIESPSDFFKKNPNYTLYKINFKNFFYSNNYQSLFLFHTHSDEIIDNIKQITSSYSQNELTKFIACQRFVDRSAQSLLGVMSKYIYRDTIGFFNKFIKNKKIEKAGDFIYTDDINNSENIIGHLYTMYI